MLRGSRANTVLGPKLTATMLRVSGPGEVAIVIRRKHVYGRPATGVPINMPIAQHTVGQPVNAALPVVVAQYVSMPTNVAQPVTLQPPDEGTCYRQGYLKKKPVSGIGGDSHRFFTLWGSHIEWRDGDRVRGFVPLTWYTEVNYSQRRLTLTVRTSDRVLTLYPPDKSAKGAADNIQAWYLAVSEVVSQIRAHHQQVKAQQQADSYPPRGGGGETAVIETAVAIGTGGLLGCAGCMLLCEAFAM